MMIMMITKTETTATTIPAISPLLSLFLLSLSSFLPVQEYIYAMISVHRSLCNYLLFHCIDLMKS